MNVKSIDDLTFYRTYILFFVANERKKNHNNKINFNEVYICMKQLCKMESCISKENIKIKTTKYDI